MKINPFRLLKQTLPQLTATDQIAELLRFSRTVSISATANRNAIADPPPLISGTASTGAGFPLCLCFLFFFEFVVELLLARFFILCEVKLYLAERFPTVVPVANGLLFFNRKKISLVILVVVFGLVDIAKLIINTRMGIFFMACTLWLE